MEDNRIEGFGKQKAHGTQISTDAETSKLVMKSSDKGCRVSSFAESVKCFSIFMAYRITVNPTLALALTSSTNVMAELAHPDRGYPVDKWLAYDARLRTMAARQSKNLELWSTVHTDTKHRTCLTSSTTSRDHEHKTWLHMTEGHDQQWLTNHVAEDDICYRYNRGHCTKKPCPSDFIQPTTYYMCIA
ncbi:hypothetical protein RvY_15617 [Ramazzottius varieornatus]|uniref:Uncharacterized protein n=1 Tax=Ramazzottius varieornatus TaxID=947166 RepID=A0A1D1VVI9_RAMVA|nr:hypothetical protein RvY_15617 [Ramazzottius varieornatus]